MLDIKDEKIVQLRTNYAFRKEAESSLLLAAAARADLANIASAILSKYPDAFYITLCKLSKDWEYNPDIQVEDILGEGMVILPEASEYANDLLENFDSPCMGIFAGVRHKLHELAQWMPADFTEEDSA